MDPLAHTLVGVALAETRLARWAGRDGRRTGVAVAACALAANAPDVDVAAYFVSGDFALEHRRGWTHGVLAWMVLPLVVTAALLLWERWRRGDLSRLSPRGLLALSFAALATHPLLDWLNTYGIRLLAPFDWRWFYGDTLFIVDPWLWLLAGGAAFLARRWGWRGLVGWALLAAATSAVVLAGTPERLPAAQAAWLAAVAALAITWSRPAWRQRLDGERGRGERVAAVGLALAALYVAAMVASAQAARGLAFEELERRGFEVASSRGRLMAGPLPVTPFRRDVVAAVQDGWAVGRWRWLPQPALEGVEVLPAVAPPDAPGAAIRAARAAPEVAGLTTWMRFPLYRLEEDEGGRRVWIVDVRYAREPGEGFATAAVRVEAAPR